MIKIMGKYSKGYRLRTFLCALFVVLEVFLEAIIPTLMAYIVDVAAMVSNGTYVVGGPNAVAWLDYLIVNVPQFAIGTNGLLWALGASSILLAMLALLFGALGARNVAVAGSGFASNLRMGMFSKIQSFSFANIDKFSTAGLVTRCTTDINNAQQSYMQINRVVVRAPLMMIMATIFAFRLASGISWLFFVAIPLMGGLMAAIIVMVFPRFKKMLTHVDGINATVQENLVGIRAVKAYVREDFETKKYTKSANDLRVAQLAAEKLMVLSNPAIMIVMYGSIVAILAMGGSQMIAGTMKSGTLTALVSYSTQILMSVTMVCFIVVQLVLSKASIARISQALDEESTIVDGDSDKTVDSGSIVFDNVNFSYSNDKDNLTLTNINLTINSGETVGIIAGTGEGKSSLVNLIPRFYDVYDGAVYVDGVNVKDYKVNNLRDGVAMVLQKNVLFSGTIEDNLRWGNEGATKEDIVNACKIACAHDFIESFPDGYNTDLGQGGVNVSGGQKQRLCIARALLKKPKILILDDSTSAVDTATDSSIRQGLKQLDSDMTVIVIAQRISSIENCDKIVVIDEGKIDAVGTHQQLLATNKIYQEVQNSQNKGVE